MKVAAATHPARAIMRAGIAIAIIAAAILMAPAQAQAITRTQVMARAKTWVAKKVPYSQSRYYRGYRRDCSGFVSMAWKLGKSYTTRNISKRATRIRVSQLRPGDAVLQPGHVAIFGGWKNKRKRTYYALEETTWGSHAKRQVRKIPSNGKALRRKGIVTQVVRRRTVPVAAASVITTDVSIPLVGLSLSTQSPSEGTSQYAEAVKVALALD